jgi:hypothetical protein
MNLESGAQGRTEGGQRSSAWPEEATLGGVRRPVRRGHRWSRSPRARSTGGREGTSLRWDLRVATRSRAPSSSFLTGAHVAAAWRLNGVSLMVGSLLPVSPSLTVADCPECRGISTVIFGTCSACFAEFFQDDDYLQPWRDQAPSSDPPTLAYGTSVDSRHG